MKPRQQTLLFIAGFISMLCLVGCSTQNKFASSFGKRRYNKGFYWDKPNSIEPVAANAGETSPAPKTALPAKAPTVTRIAESGLKNTTGYSPAPAMKPKAEEVKTPRTLITSVANNYRRYLHVAAPDAKTLPETVQDANTGKGLFSISGFVLSLTGLGLLIFGSWTGMLLLIAILADVAGVILCIYAVVIIDKYDGFAMIALALNALILGLTFGVRL